MGKILEVHNQEAGTLDPDHQGNGFANWKKTIDLGKRTRLSMRTRLGTLFSSSPASHHLIAGPKK